MTRSPHFARGRRFVVVGGDRAVADGCAFLSGPVVLTSRTEHGVTVYHDVTELPSAVQDGLRWIDEPPVPYKPRRGQGKGSTG